MIRIAIIDDEVHMHDRIEGYVKEAVAVGERLEVAVFQNAEQFKDALKKENVFQIVLLDINLPKMSGIELGKFLREKYEDMYLIFLTAYDSYAVESYEIGAQQYVLKKNMGKRLPSVLKDALKKISEENSQYRSIGVKLSRKKLYYSDIIYIYKKKGDKYVYYVTEEAEYRERISLKELEQELLSRDFVMVERGYIVNLNHVVSMSKEGLCLSNGAVVTVSRARTSKVKEQINAWWRGGR